MEIVFTSHYDWVLPPRKNTIAVPKEELAVYDTFRWVRRSRRKELCYPWRLGQGLGWDVPSPIDVTIHPFDDIEISAAPAELENAHRTLGLNNFWDRGETFLSVSHDWMRLYQFRGAGNKWEGMFIPNGEGTVEWRLGFSADLPDGYSLLIAPHQDTTAIDVPYGVLSKKDVDKMNRIGGLSVPIKPKATKTSLRRHDPIARLILIETATLTCDTTYR